jgi:anti-sigma-K factor RskA
MQQSWRRTALATAVIAALGAAPAHAADPAKAGDTSKSPAADQTTTPSAASPSTSGAAGSAEFTGRHTMTGEVTRVDSKTGKFSLKTAEGTLDLHAPPSALQNVKKGDRLTVEIALKPEGGSPSASPAGGHDGASKPDSTKKY